MKRLTPIAMLAILALAGCASFNTTNMGRGGKCVKSKQVLRHVVLFKFKDDIKPEEVREIENAFAALPSKIKEIHDFEMGTDVSVENLAQGYTHCFFVTFLSEEDRAVYLPHPAHKKFGETLKKDGRLDKALVFDYWTSE